APAQDFKRVGDGDAGPNTGGMGAFSPVPGVDLEMVVEVAVEPTLQALRKRDIDYRGVLYAGLMRTPDGLKVIEFNVRFGDPEAQVVLPRLSCDLAAILAEAANGRTETAPTFVPDATVCVVLAVEGYPESPRAGSSASRSMNGCSRPTARPTTSPRSPVRRASRVTSRSSARRGWRPTWPERWPPRPRCRSSGCRCPGAR